MTTAGGRLQALVSCPGPMGIFEQSAALIDRGWLGRMAIDFYADLHRPPLSWLPDGKVRSILRRRHHPDVPGRLVRSHKGPAIAARVVRPLSRRRADEWVFWQNHRFDAWAARFMGERCNLAFGYESSSLYTFRRARELGFPTVLYQPIGCAETALEVLGEERRRHPHLADSLRYAWFPPSELIRRREERGLADAILCASSFTRDTLIAAGVEPATIFVEPYGVQQKNFWPSEEKFSRFSVVWASAFTQTKGIGYLMEALALNPVPRLELVLAGHPHGDDVVAPYEDRVRVRRVGRVDRQALGGVMRRAHVHVFPTLLDGFGRNIIEAMASGLPVVTTPNCAGPELIEDGVTGFIVPIRDVEAIADRLRWVHDNPAEAREMGLRAAASVAALTPESYRTRFADFIGAVHAASGTPARSR